MSQSPLTDNLVKPTLNYSDAVPEINLSQPQVPTEAAIEHFDVLLGAVVERLMRAVDAANEMGPALSVSATPTPTPTPTAEEVSLRLRMTVLECIEALEQLQTTQQYLRGRARAI